MNQHPSRNAAILLVSLLVTACYPPITQSVYSECRKYHPRSPDRFDCDRKQEFYLNHPKTSKRAKNLINKGLIATGLTAAQVKASWGEPDEVNIYDAGRTQQWIYGESQYIYFRNGVVSDWQHLQ